MKPMIPYVIDNPVPTPEEMAEILGVSAERLEEIRKIMNTPVRRKKSADEQIKKSRQKNAAPTRANGRSLAKT